VRRINDIEISEMAFNAMVRKMHNKVRNSQRLFEIQQSSDVYLKNEDMLLAQEKLKMWDKEWAKDKEEYERIKKEELHLKILEKEKQKEEEAKEKYILELKKNSKRNEEFLNYLNSKIKNDNENITIIPKVSYWTKAGEKDYIFDYRLYSCIIKWNTSNKNSKIINRELKTSDIHEYVLVKHNILKILINIAQENKLPNLYDLYFVINKRNDIMRFFIYYKKSIIEQIEFPEV